MTHVEVRGIGPFRLTSTLHFIEIENKVKEWEGVYLRLLLVVGKLVGSGILRHLEALSVCTRPTTCSGASATRKQQPLWQLGEYKPLVAPGPDFEPQCVCVTVRLSSATKGWGRGSKQAWPMYFQKDRSPKESANAIE